MDIKGDVFERITIKQVSIASFERKKEINLNMYNRAGYKTEHNVEYAVSY